MCAILDTQLASLKILPKLALVISIFFLTCLHPAVGEAIAGEKGYYEPARGSQQRKAIMDAARIPITREIGTRVIFHVSILRTDGRRAYLQATPLNPDSSPLDWSKTPFSQEWKKDMMSDVIMVLLERRGSRWVVKDYVIGPTDVFWYVWVSKYALPEALFGGG